MRGFSLYAVVSLAVIALLAWLLSFVFGAPDAQRAIWTSAVIAYVLQLFTFAVVKGMQRQNVMAGWGIGVLMRIVTLGVYALAIVKAFELAPEPALLSLATFLFVSTLVEPVLLKT